MEILLLFDSFKHSASSATITTYVTDVLRGIDNSIRINGIPISDGGEGVLEVIELQSNFTKVYVEVCDPVFNKITSYYLKNNHIAYIELAKASGIELLPAANRNCMNTSTFGTGELINHAITNGCTKIVIFAGGSATNDAGIGAAAALSFQFIDETGTNLQPIGRNLNRIVSIISPKKLPQIKFTIATDVNNPLYGENGAAYVYAKQKGASVQEIAELDSGLQNVNELLVSQGFANLQNISGAGAAGGFPAMFVSYFNAEITSGTNLVFSLLKIEEAIKKADLIITGEGKTDAQTLNGKLVQSVCKLAEKYQKPVWLLSGLIENPTEIIKKLKVNQCFSLIKTESEVELSVQNPKQFIIKLADQLKAALQNLA